MSRHLLTYSSGNRNAELRNLFLARTSFLLNHPKGQREIKEGLTKITLFKKLIPESRIVVLLQPKPFPLGTDSLVIKF